MNTDQLNLMWTKGKNLIFLKSGFVLSEKEEELIVLL